MQQKESVRKFDLCSETKSHSVECVCCHLMSVYLFILKYDCELITGFLFALVFTCTFMECVT